MSEIVANEAAAKAIRTLRETGTELLVLMTDPEAGDEQQEAARALVAYLVRHARAARISATYDSAQREPHP